jgi:hypothetical protein
MEILRQRDWTADELRAQGFRYYQRKRQVVMARALPAAESPKTIHTDWDTLVATTGYMICYDVSDGALHASLDRYKHWPVEPHIFEITYRAWDAQFAPTTAEAHLAQLGCKPYYKFIGLWAKKVVRPAYVQTLESVSAVEVPLGAYLTIGIKGEPTSMTAHEFYNRYEPPPKNSTDPVPFEKARKVPHTAEQEGVLMRVVAWLRGR